MKNYFQNSVKGNGGRKAPILAATTLGILAATFWLGSASAQPFDGFLEGPISNVVLSSDPNDGIQGTVRINGILATVPDGIQISSPTNSGLTLADIKLDTGGPLPGRPTGFENGTCLCATVFDPTTGEVTITDFVAEPAENVAIASVTAHMCSTIDCSDPQDELRVGGVLVIKNTDPRIESAPPTDAGFEVDLSSTSNGSLVGHTAAVEGYLGTYDTGAGEEPALFYYALEIEGATRVNEGSVEIAIERAQCRDRQGGEYRVRGNVSDDVGGNVTLWELDDFGNMSVQIGIAVPVLNEATGFLEWDIRGPGSGSCSDNVRAEYGGAGVDSPVDIRN